MGVIENIPLDAFKRDKTLKQIRAAYGETQNQQQLVHELDEFFVANELYRDVVPRETVLDHISAEELKLIAYEVFA